ncbi:MAG TPA: TetR/AcrR family transcriptional regulator [Solirubrobacteraceae bacterium]|nr:TetR/AcrR family transcriptional regulator [Solirubrobacteraceae bacterium]
MFDVTGELGAANVSVAHVVERSGVSRRTFYETFSDCEDCLLAAFDDALALARQRVLPAYRAERRWRERIRAGVIAFLSFLDEEPVIGCLLIRESLTGGAKMRTRREHVLAQLASTIDQGREESTNAAIPLLTAEGLVGGVLSIVEARISPSNQSSLLGLANMLVSMIVLPYLGTVAARRELNHPVEAPANDRPGPRLLGDPFKDTGMRLTYRTVRVLMTVAGHPNASNRTIGESAGIKDQGQISKLLGRLQRLGVIENTGLDPGQGAPNAWILTANGRELAESIRANTEGSQSYGASER